jgi:antitoxin YefM
MNADMLDEDFLKAIKMLFKNREIEIAIYDAETEEDTTEYLMRSPKNRERLLKAIEDVEKGKNLIFPDQEQFR